MKDWVWLALIGTGLEIVGLGIAICGVGETKQELFPGRPTPLGRVRSAVREWFGRNVLRRRPQTLIAEARGIAIGGGMGSGSAQLTPPRPGSLEPSEAWIRHLVQRLDDLETHHERNLREIRQLMARIEERAVTVELDLRTAIGQVDEKLERSVGGEGGRGLDRAWWGLAITFVGVVLQFLAMCLG